MILSRLEVRDNILTCCIKKWIYLLSYVVTWLQQRSVLYNADCYVLNTITSGSVGRLPASCDVNVNYTLEKISALDYSC